MPEEIYSWESRAMADARARFYSGETTQDSFPLFIYDPASGVAVGRFDTISQFMELTGYSEAHAKMILKSNGVEIVSHQSENPERSVAENPQSE